MLRRFFLVMLGVLCLAPAQADHHLEPVDPPVEPPSFFLRDLEGKFRSLDEFSGRPVFINFWATWCPPCREEIPSMNYLAEHFGHTDLAMIAVAVDEPADKVKKFVSEVPMNMTVLLDSSGKVAKEWGVVAYPMTFLMDRTGHIVFAAEGSRFWDKDSLVEAIEAFIGAEEETPSLPAVIQASASDQN